MQKETSVVNTEGITDARALGVPKMILFGIQHMFAMFGATVLVPMLTGLDVATTLLMAGVGTLLFHLICKGKVPAFLGSSFAFISGYAAVSGEAGTDLHDPALLTYACLGVACAGLVYLVLAAIIKAVGANRVMRFFPPIVTGPLIIAIGLTLAGSAVDNCTTNWVLALIALGTVIVFNIWSKGMARIIPIILGILISYAAAVVLHVCTLLHPALLTGPWKWLFDTGLDFSGITAIIQNITDGRIFGAQGLIGLPIFWEKTVFGGIDWSNTSRIVSAIVAIVPIALATMMEHIGDISAISSTTGNNFIEKPGLHRTLTGDGLATTLASLFGAPANTTYGENTGVLALTRVYDPRVVRIAAYFAITVSFFPIVSAAISTIPSAIIGGISFVLYGMISAIGVRNVVENQVDLTKSRNLIVAAVILVCALGLDADTVRFMIGGVQITLSPLAVAAIVGIVLNAAFPGKEDGFGRREPEKTGVGFAIAGEQSKPERTE